MRKETLILQAETKEVRDFMLAQFKECIEFAGSGQSFTFPITARFNVFLQFLQCPNNLRRRCLLSMA
jgi:hypothetical protein